MKDHSLDKNNQILSLILKKLSLRFPVADLEKRTNFKRSNISNYINNKKPVSENFISAIIKEYDLDTNEINRDYEDISKNGDPDNEVNPKRSEEAIKLIQLLYTDESYLYSFPEFAEYIKGKEAEGVRKFLKNKIENRE